MYSPVHPKGNQSWVLIGRTIWKDRGWSWNANPLATWCKELTHWKRACCWERLKAGGKGDDRGWDGWIVSPTWWTWVWVNSGSWWWPARPGMPQSMGSQRLGHNWLNWTDSPDTKLGNRAIRIYNTYWYDFYLPEACVFTNKTISN